jgi:hypothetical protein
MPTAEGHFVLGLCVLHAARRNLLTQNRLFCYAQRRADRPIPVVRTVCQLTLSMTLFNELLFL